MDDDKKLEGQGTDDQNNAGATGNNNDQNQNNNNNAGQSTGDNNGNNDSKGEKTFTQDDVNRMMTREKKQGANSVYNELGIKPGDKKSIEAVKKFLESQKTDAQKEAESIAANNAALEEANHKLALAEAKAEAMQLGVQAQFVDDAVTLALGKVASEDGTDIKTALGELKIKYPVWFEGGNADDKDSKAKTGQRGTGSSVNSGQKDKGDDNKNLGARLAANRKVSATKKSYWSKN